MPRKPDFPCPGCGEMLWSGKSSADPSRRLCRPCRRARASVTLGMSAEEEAAARYVARKESTAERACAWCRSGFKSTDAAVRCCSLSCAQRLRNAEGRGRRTYETIDDRRDAQLRVWQQKNRRRRALKRGAASEPYTLEEIAERDEFLCGICAGPVDMGLRCPDRQAPTIDHVVPIVAGGDDTLANVQLAHFGCNSRKGARVA